MLISTAYAMRKLLLGAALLALALPAMCLDFSETAASVYRPKSLATADINYFEEMAELFNRAEAPSPADLKTAQKGQLTLKTKPLAVRPSKLTVSFDGKTRLVCVDKQGEDKKYAAFDIVSPLTAAVEGAGKVHLRKNGTILLAKIMSGKDVLGYAIYGSPKAPEAEAAPARNTPKSLSTRIPAVSASAYLPMPARQAVKPSASPIVVAPPAIKLMTAKAEALPQAATIQAVVPPLLAAATPAKANAKRKPLADTIASVVSSLETALGKAVKTLTADIELVKSKLVAAAKKHPLVVKIGIGVAAAVILGVLGISAYFVFQSGILSFLTSTVVGTALQLGGKKLFELIFKKPKPPKT